MVGRGELTDKAWERIAPLLPKNGRRGAQWKDHRKVMNGILWKLRTGAPWRDAPSRYGPWQTCRIGVGGERGLQRRSGAPARRRSTPRQEPGGRKRGVEHPSEEALGRSRGGFTTKIHLACDARGRPLSVLVTEGQRHEGALRGGAGCDPGTTW